MPCGSPLIPCWKNFQWTYISQFLWERRLVGDASDGWPNRQTHLAPGSAGYEIVALESGSDHRRARAAPHEGIFCPVQDAVFEFERPLDVSRVIVLIFI